jgi:alkaline phosphatase D
MLYMHYYLMSISFILLGLCINPVPSKAQVNIKATQTKDQEIIQPSLDSSSQPVKAEYTIPNVKFNSNFKAHPLLVAGPLLGFAGHHEVKIWLQTKEPAKIQIRYWPITNRRATQLSPIFHSNGQEVFTLQAILSPLKSGTRYGYQVILNDQIAPFPYQLQFQTQVVWKRLAPPPNFSFAMGSCAYLNTDPEDSYGHNPKIFERIRSMKPDFMLWLGDMVYLKSQDWSSRTGIFRRYSRYRAHPALQALYATVHHYAMWDDHDYGPNDGNRSYVHKQDSLDAFKTFWPNPSYGMPQTPGIFTTFSWSDVDFFVLDNRTYRADNLAPNDEHKDYLGTAQLQWLLDALSNSRATFKIIASGSQVLSPYARFESYARHSHELHSLLSSIKRYKIEGVVFVSGDRHHSELNRLDDDPHFYPLYDFTSSPLTSGLARSATDELKNPRRVKGTFVYQHHNFGVLKVSGAPKHRRLLMQNYTSDGKLLWEYQITEEELKIPTLP